jgi:hypothetical protein
VIRGKGNDTDRLLLENKSRGSCDPPGIHPKGSPAGWFEHGEGPGHHHLSAFAAPRSQNHSGPGAQSGTGCRCPIRIEQRSPTASSPFGHPSHAIPMAGPASRPVHSVWRNQDLRTTGAPSSKARSSQGGRPGDASKPPAVDIPLTPCRFRRGSRRFSERSDHQTLFAGSGACTGAGVRWWVFYCCGSPSFSLMS